MFYLEVNANMSNKMNLIEVSKNQNLGYEEDVGGWEVDVDATMG